MLTLCGFAASNYYLKVKLALLEKGVAFDERLVWVGSVDAAASPLGKVPFIETPAGCLSESSVINEYIEDAHPAVPLFPADPWQRAKVRELTNLLDMHLELHARRLYPGAFFGGSVSDETKAQVRKELDKGVAALGRLAKFAPFIAGESLTYADCAAYVHLPLISASTKWAYGADLLAGIEGVRPYLGMLRARPHMQKVDADRKANLEVMQQRNRK